MMTLHDLCSLPRGSRLRGHTRCAIALLLSSCWIALSAAPSQAAPLQAAPLQAIDQSFLKQYCVDCHSSQTNEGGLDLTAISQDLSSEAALAKWEQVHDRIASGEMPPRDAQTQLPDSARKDFLIQMARQLSEAHAQRKSTVLRRLNRQEYQNTLNDIFGTNLKLIDLLPEDGRAHEFDNVGQALSISMVQMQRYMDCAEMILNASIAARVDPIPSTVQRTSYADTRGAEQWLNKIWLHRDDGAVVFFKQYGYPSGMLREANVRQDGWYKVRVTGYAFQSADPITFSIGASTYARGVEQPTFAFVSLPPGAPSTVEIKAWIPRNYMIELTPYGISDKNFELKQVGATGYKGPGLAIQHIEIEGPLSEEFPSRGHHLLFDGIQRVEKLPRNPQDRLRPNYVATFEIKSEDARADGTRAIGRVANRLFRRPTTNEQLKPYVALFESELNKGLDFENALRTSVIAMLCAPDFLYLRELPQPTTAARDASLEGSYALDDYSLASRLSYFLTRSAPDDELLAAAAKRSFTTNRKTLLEHADRLLKRPESSRFVADFTDAWLNLRDIQFTNPDEALYPEFDPYLQWSMIEETRATFRKLIDENRGAEQIVRSDFAMLNGRLAEHYGMPAIQGSELRAVALPPDSMRGGFLSQASVLKVSANGTNTSPVVRGVWVMERILGQQAPPPPPGVPGVEPDIRGATTLRELLDKHRNLDTCRACHQKIDPPGFALECFDPIGGYRERFRSLGQGEKTDQLVRGQKVRYRMGAPVDASGQLAGGEPFADFREFRNLIARDKKMLAKTFVSKLLTFATGREMGFSDRSEIERIVESTSASNYGMRDLLERAIASDIVTSK